MFLRININTYIHIYIYVRSLLILSTYIYTYIYSKFLLRLLIIVTMFIMTVFLRLIDYSLSFGLEVPIYYHRENVHSLAVWSSFFIFLFFHLFCSVSVSKDTVLIHHTPRLNDTYVHTYTELYTSIYIYTEF